VSRFDFSSGKVVYLSDLEPEFVEWTPFFAFSRDAAALAEFGSPRRDAALEGGPLKLNGTSIAKGLALRSRCVMTYRLPGSFREFSALAGIDDRMGDRGHVRLLIRGDDRDLLDKIITGRDAAMALRVGIENVKRLTIVVDYGDDQDFADQLDLGEAKVSK
jgi:beta-galactosidase